MSRHICVLEAGNDEERELLDGNDVVELEIHSIDVDPSLVRIDVKTNPSFIPEPIFIPGDETTYGSCVEFDPTDLSEGSIRFELFADDEDDTTSDEIGALAAD